MEVVRIVFQANIMAGSPGITTNEESADQYIEVLSGLSSDDKVVIGDDVKTAEAAAAENGRRRRGPF